MSTPNWDAAAGPLMSTGISRREGQAQLGQAIIEAINNKSTLVAQAPTGTGKSFCAAIPLINKVLEAKKHNKVYRGGISTETITLQRQIAEKDLPYLQKLYPGFTFKKLMGRNNYLCLYNVHVSAYGDSYIESLYQKLQKRKDDIGAGELPDVERVLGMEIDAELWSKLQGSQNFCTDNDCQPDGCFAAAARAEALGADIVVVNHALLGVDAELKGRGDVFAEGVLGSLQTIIVDEAHALEPVLVSQWTEELTHWQVSSYIDSFIYTVGRCINIKGKPQTMDVAQKTTESIYEIFENVHNFFEVLAIETHEDWKFFESAISEKYLPGSSSSKLKSVLIKYEVDNKKLLATVIPQLQSISNYMNQINAYLQEFAVKIEKRRRFNKGFRSLKELINILIMLDKALDSKDGIIDNFGKTGVIFQGWVKSDLSHGMTIRFVPLDVSKRASDIWKNVSSSILLSATLTDLTDNSFTYARRCVGFPDGPEINVASPFDYATKQLIYKTSGKGTRVDDAQYAMQELLDLIFAVDGRSLLLFTAKKELEYAAKVLQEYKIYYKDKFPYQILVQTDGSNKQKLLEEFKKDTHSILLGLKSFFVGVDVPGEALTHVALCKFPLARYSIECKMRIIVWRMKGFPRWYEMESLTTMAQAAGRLIRTTDDHGVISILDFRVANTHERVAQTAQIGINALGSPVTHSIDEVHAFVNNNIQKQLASV